jgi:hypothetical protein
MSRFESHLDTVDGARVVRWPFRVLAALLVAAVCFAQISLAYLAIARNDSRSQLLALALLPITGLILRSAGAACATSRVPRRPFWPFASGTVAFVWVMLLFLGTQFA